MENLPEYKKSSFIYVKLALLHAHNYEKTHPLSTSFAFATKGYAQDDLKYNVVTTAVPILLVSPDSRAGAMGDVGVASTPDGNSSAWNPAKLAFLEDKEANMALSYTPWMSRLVPDIDLAYVNYSKALSDRQGIAASLRYFSFG